MGGWDMQKKALNPKATVCVATEVSVSDAEDEPPGQRPFHSLSAAILPLPRPQADTATIVPFPKFRIGSTSGRMRFRRKFFPGVSTKL